MTKAFRSSSLLLPYHIALTVPNRDGMAEKKVPFFRRVKSIGKKQGTRGWLLENHLVIRKPLCARFVVPVVLEC